MKRTLHIILLFLIAVVGLSINAKVIKYQLSDGTEHAITSSELSSIEFNDDGTITLTTYDGKQVTTTDVDFSILEIGDRETLTAVIDTTLYFGYNGINFSSRKARQFNFIYPSTDPFGEPITLSGCIVIPNDILDGSKSSEGVILFNHYTIFNKDEAPTNCYSTLEGMFLANPLSPNYIIVESDFYGFGATVRFPQAYLQGTVNARASLDCLIAARNLLQEMGINYGDLTFNVGYSSGGFDALSTQKLRDMEYSDVISFDKTFAGGSPNDVAECYRQYVEIDSTAYNAVLALLMVSTNEIQQLNLDYNDVFYPYIADKIDDWIHSKNHSSWPICDSIGREKKVHEILKDVYCDLNSEQAQLVLELFEQNSIATGWEPDLSQRLYIFHGRDDDYVPVQSARPIIAYLKGKGMEPSIIPGKTHLQTNFVVPKLGHLTATIVYLVQSVAAIKAWPLMYTDGELNPIYADLISHDFDLVATMRQLDAMGFDCRAIIMQILNMISEVGEGSSISITDILNYLSNAGVDVNALNEMCQDSGFDMTKFLLDLYIYFSEYTPTENVPTSNNAHAVQLMDAIQTPVTPADEYEQQFRQWLDENDIK